MNLPADWQPDGAGAKGTCPLCRGGRRRRAWLRSYSGRLFAGCPECDAKSAALIDALGTAGLDAAAFASSSRRQADRPVDLESCNWAARLPAVDMNDPGRRYLDRRGLSPVPELRWADLAALAASPRADWIFPTRQTGTGRDRREVAAPWGFDRTAVAGALVWLWRRLAPGGALEVCGVELEGVTSEGVRIDFIDKRSGRPVKRVSIFNTYPTRGAFVARSPGGPGRAGQHRGRWPGRADARAASTARRGPC